MKPLVFLGVAVMAALVCGGTAASAQGVSPWSQEAHSAVRLVAGTTDAGGERRHAGIQIRLQQGWKTYWRYPGDSGVPPRFDFSRSKNLRSAEVRFPAPKRFQDGDGYSIGYAGDVIFPVQVAAADARADVTLILKIDYAICETICVPAQADLTLTLPPKGGATDAQLAASQARVPQRVALAEGEGLAIVSVQREAAAKPRILVDVKAPPGEALDLFAEGPTPDWSLPLPAPVPGAPEGLRRFAFELDGAPTGASLEGPRLVLTAVTPTRAIETVVNPR